MIRTVIQRAMVFLQLLVVLACWVGPSESFTVHTMPATTAAAAATVTATSLHMFGGLKDAFKNDDSLGTRPNEGLKGGPNYNEAVTVNGTPVKGAVVGQKLTVVASKVRVKIPVNCQKGDCGTCMVTLNGRKVKGAQRRCYVTRGASHGVAFDFLACTDSSLLAFHQSTRQPARRASLRERLPFRPCERFL
jgi:ferredoxin